jgi:hypothetical protein
MTCDSPGPMPIAFRHGGASYLCVLRTGGFAHPLDARGAGPRQSGVERGGAGGNDKSEDVMKGKPRLECPASSVTPKLLERICQVGKFREPSRRLEPSFADSLTNLTTSDESNSNLMFVVCERRTV